MVIQNQPVVKSQISKINLLVVAVQVEADVICRRVQFQMKLEGEVLVADVDLDGVRRVVHFIFSKKGPGQKVADDPCYAALMFYMM